ncbi:MAG: MopE-related protein [Myxococcota bacterium]
MRMTRYLLLAALATSACGPRCDRVWYADRDGDGYGDRSATERACERPEAMVADASDCDDREPSVHPGATDACNGIDDDCDGVIDGDEARTWYRDLDNDGVGATDHAVTACAAPDGYVDRPGDCDDGDPSVHPGPTVELCDGKDQDCDGLIDEEAPGTVTYYPDDDFDGYGDGARGRVYCAPPAGWITRPGDCDDSSPARAPNLLEICNGFDDDCDGLVDLQDPDGALGAIDAWLDADLDGYGDPASEPTPFCSVPFGFAANDDDCDDTLAGVHPGATEVCGFGDDDCDGLVDDDDPSLSLASTITGWRDADGDGYGDPTVTSAACALGDGVVSNAEDCDDGDPEVGPDWWVPDADGDGAGSGTAVAGQGCAPLTAGQVNVLAPVDCADDDPSVRPGLPDPCGDGVDQDCTGVDPVCGEPAVGILDLSRQARGWATGSQGPDAYQVVAAGTDFDGDGFGDAVLGSVAGGSDVLVLPGPGPEVAGPWAPSMRLPALGTGYGAALAAIPDVDGDGLPDLAVGAPYEAPGGSVSMVSPLAPEGAVLSVVGFPGDDLGAALAFAGDVSGTGAGDVLVGRPAATARTS